MRLPAASDPDARRALTELKKMMAGIDQSLAGLLSSLPRLQQAKQAQRRIFADRAAVRARSKATNSTRSTRWQVALAATPASSRVRDRDRPPTVVTGNLLRVEAAAGDAPAVGTQQVEERREHRFGPRQLLGSEQRLDRSYVGAAIEQVRGEAVP